MDFWAYGFALRRALAKEVRRGSGSTEYLHFYEIDYEFVEPVEAELNKLGVVFVGKYETLALKRGFLWDNRK